MAESSDKRCRSWFVTVWGKSIHNMGLGDLLDNENKPLDGSGKEIVEQVCEIWACSGKGRTSGGVACISVKEGFHLHVGVYTPNPMKKKDVANVLGNSHVDEQRGTKEQLVKYIKKEGKFEEKGETVLYLSNFDGIGSCQGNRSDLSQIEDYLEHGFTPRQIMELSLSYRKYDKMIKDAYFEKRSRETLFLRHINVIWHVGESGSGKSYISKMLVDAFGEDKIYMLTDYDNGGTGGLDKYCGEPILFMDEFRGQIPYSKLLSMLQGYKTQVHSRYTNIIGLWDIVHITSVLPPEKVYNKMVSEDKDLDTLQQLKRRLSVIVYHYKQDGEYKTFEMLTEDYINYEDLKRKANQDEQQVNDGFLKIDDNEDLPWQ